MPPALMPEAPYISNTGKIRAQRRVLFADLLILAHRNTSGFQLFFDVRQRRQFPINDRRQFWR